MSLRAWGRLARIVMLAAVIALVATACAGAAETTDTGAGGEVTVEEQEGITIVMDDFSFTPDTVTVAAGQEVEVTLINEGKKEHELMIGLPVGGGPEWETDLFGRLEPEVVSGEEYKLEGFEGMEEMGEEGHEEEEGEEHHGAELELEPGGEVTLRLQIPVDAAGEWEMGCFLPDHYEKGMKGTLVVE